jgi:hypothetical protein
MVELAATIFCAPFIIAAICLGLGVICWIIAIPFMIGKAILDALFGTVAMREHNRTIRPPHAPANKMSSLGAVLLVCLIPLGLALGQLLGIIH